MKTLLTVYGCLLAGVLAAGGVAYWYYVEHLEEGNGPST